MNTELTFHDGDAIGWLTPILFTSFMVPLTSQWKPSQYPQGRWPKLKHKLSEVGLTWQSSKHARIILSSSGMNCVSGLSCQSDYYSSGYCMIMQEKTMKHYFITPNIFTLKTATWRRSCFSLSREASHLSLGNLKSLPEDSPQLLLLNTWRLPIHGAKKPMIWSQDAKDHSGPTSQAQRRAWEFSRLFSRVAVANCNNLGTILKAERIFLYFLSSLFPMPVLDLFPGCVYCDEFHQTSYVLENRTRLCPFCLTLVFQKLFSRGASYKLTSGKHIKTWDSKK